MATDSTLQKIADNLLAQFDKTLLDNSTDFSSCDQILNAAPSEHKGGLESLYCDLLGRTYFGLLQVFRDGHQAVGR